MVRHNNLLNVRKRENEISGNVEALQKIIGEDNSYLNSKEKLEEIHSIAWSIQLQAERMLKMLSDE